MGLQVIWAIGASMVVLGGAQFLGRRTCLAIGVAVVVGHNPLDGIWPIVVETEPGPAAWIALHARMTAVVGPFHVFLIYPLLPSIGVMTCAAGSRRSRRGVETGG